MAKKLKSLLSQKDLKLTIPEGYVDLLNQLKEKIRKAQLKAAIAVNNELVFLYWEIGNMLSGKMKEAGWGAKVIDRLANDIGNDFPGISGFSPRNLRYMRKFFESYSDLSILQAVPAKLPWWHNILLLEKLDSQEERMWYAQQTIVNGWSGRALDDSIKSKLYLRQGKAITNFQDRLPSPHSKLAHDILKSPYNFGFLTLSNDYIEHELELGLIQNIEKLILELGQGFAFIGRQYHLEIAGDDYYLDMIFYHIKLRAFCVVELKSTDFKPEYAGKMNFYLAAVDEQLKHPTDNPSIGMIICRTKNDLKVEYALKRVLMPMSVSGYEVKIHDALPEELQGTLPTAEEIEAGLSEHHIEDIID